MGETIRDYIKRDLGARLRSAAGPPVPLTLPALARHYGVSPTPVREALRDLIATGLLRKQPNGRVNLSPLAARRARARTGVSPASEGPGGVPSPARGLEAALLAEVVRGSLLGEADYLREEATARRLGVGRTALRQAFGRLVGQGWLVHVPRCGWRVRPFDAADLSSYLEIRETLELKALDLARPRLDKADLRRMLAANAAPRLDNRLHGYLIARSGNPYLRDFFDRHGAYYTALFDFAAPAAEVVRAMARQHRAILRALIREDWDAARAALAEHIRAQLPVVETLTRRVATEGTP